MNKIQSYLFEHQNEMIALTEKIINIDTNPGNIEGIQQVIDILSNKMHELGMTTQQIDSGKIGTVLVGELGITSSLSPVILDGHLDTVFPVGTAQKRPFKIVGDKMTGPGIFDMKSGLVIGLYAIQALRHFQLLKRPVKMIIVSDEEKLHINSRAYQIIAKEARKGAYGLNLEGADTPKKISTNNRGGMIIDLIVHGHAAHSGADPEKGRNAILELAHKIVRLSALTDLKQGIHVNCGIVNGGISENIIPDQAKASLGIRFRTLVQRDLLLKQIKQIAKDQIISDTTTDVVIRTQIDALEETQAVQQLLMDLNKAAAHLKMDSFMAGNDGGSSDAGILSANGIPTLDGLGIVGGDAHTDHEFASVQSLVSRSALIAELIHIKG